MGLFGNIFFIFGLVDFVIVIAVEPHLKIKGMGNVFYRKVKYSKSVSLVFQDYCFLLDCFNKF